MTASTTKHLPIKGILKNKVSLTSVEAATQQSGGVSQEVKRKKSQRWDESNILATHRRSYRDYDLMKMNTPSTQGISVQDDAEDTMGKVRGKEIMTPDILAEKLAATDTFGISRQMEEQDISEAHISKFLLDEQERQRQFEMKRKLHHNEGLNIKLARQVISEELQSEEEEDETQCLNLTNEAKTTMDAAPRSDELETKSSNA